MENIGKIHHRHTIRLHEYDYSLEGAYFITICTYKRECILGNIKDNKMVLNEYGEIVNQCWKEIPQHYPNVLLDEMCIMPNHIHGIIVLKNVGVQNSEPPYISSINQYQRIIPKSIGSIIRGFKIGVTNWFHAHTSIKTVWQRNFYEHIIRQEENLNQIREYIIENPQNWLKDENYLQ